MNSLDRKTYFAHIFTFLLLLILERKFWGNGKRTNGGSAPIPRKKEGRAARLALMLERDGHAGGPMISTLPGEEDTAPPSPSALATEPNTPMDIPGSDLADPQIGMEDRPMH